MGEQLFGGGQHRPTAATDNLLAVRPAQIARRRSSVGVPGLVAFIAGAAVGGNALGCSIVLDAEPAQCVTHDDCSARGQQFTDTECVDGFCERVAPESSPDDEEDETCEKTSECAADEVCVDLTCIDRWECVSNPGEASSTSLSIKVNVPVSSIFGDPLPGTPAKLCRSVDPNCGTPAGMITSNEQSVYSIDLDETFTGYLEVSVEPFFPILYYLPTRLRDGMTLPNLTLSPTAVIAGLGMAVGAELNPERGHILIAAKTCLGDSADAVSFVAPRADANCIPYYVLDGVPSADLTETTANGSGGFLNFPPGNATVVLSTESQSELHTVSLTIRPNFITSVNFNPAEP